MFIVENENGETLFITEFENVAQRYLENYGNENFIIYRGEMK
jgi:hypothetical protein